MRSLITLISGLMIAGLCSNSLQAANNIVHDTEYYILKAQNGEQWAKDDKAVDKKMAEFRKKNGGKSPNILVDDVDFAAAMAGALGNMMLNSGQSCAAPSRLLVPKSKLAEVNEIAKQMLQGYVVGDPSREDINLGPVANKAQFDKVQGLIEKGIEEGATLVTGGPGKPEGLETGYYVRPTVFSDVSNDMSIAREEIFGPVLCIIPYEDDADAIRIANDTDYGLSAYVTAEDKDRARRIAEQLRAGSVFINGPDLDPMAPLGGYKQSGNGREWGVGGLEEYLETKSMLGFGEASDADAENAVKLT